MPIPHESSDGLTDMVRDIDTRLRVIEMYMSAQKIKDDNVDDRLGTIEKRSSQIVMLVLCAIVLALLRDLEIK